MNPQSMARKLKIDPKSRTPLRWEGVVWNTIAGRHHGFPGRIPCNTSNRKRKLRKREEPRTRCQGPARGQNTGDGEVKFKLCSNVIEYCAILFLYSYWPITFFSCSLVKLILITISNSNNTCECSFLIPVV